MHTNISLYGNIIKDFVNGSTEPQLGGIFNVARALPKEYNITCSCAVNSSDYNLNFGFNSLTQISNLKTSKAEIFVNQNDYVAKVELGACRDFQIFPIDGDWHHVVYLNTLPRISPEQLKDLSYYGIVSADLCLGNFRSTEIVRVHALAKEIDFLFMNDKEALSLFSNTNFKNIAKQATIIHSKDCVVVITPETNNSFRFLSKPNFNTLGAGDRYCARFIDLFLESSNIEGSAFLAYEE